MSSSDLENYENIFRHGVALCAHGKAREALPLIEEAFRAMPERADIVYNYGVALQQVGRLSSAVIAWRQATMLAPQFQQPWANLALGLTLLGRLDEALQVYGDALPHHPTDRDLIFNHASLLSRTGAFEQAHAAFNRLLILSPDDAAALINAGKTAKSLGRLDEAEDLYRRAMVQPDRKHQAAARFNLANLLLARGQWEEGFTHYEARLQLPGAPAAPWDLETLSARTPTNASILLWNDQGVGDAIMYARFIQSFAAMGYKPSLFVQTPLKPLFAAMPCVQAVYDPSDMPETIDASFPLCSLPALLRSKPDSSWRVNYLPLPAGAPFTLSATTAGTKKIGLVWAGRATHENDAQRSMKLADFAPLFDIAGTTWHSLQVGDASAQINDGFAGKVIDLSPELTDFAATARAMQSLDLVITVDTAAAHLAGALSRSVWTLLPAQDTDWRWGTHSDTTFWYPSMRLFRQTTNKDWTDVITNVAKSLTNSH